MRVGQIAPGLASAPAEVGRFRGVEVVAFATGQSVYVASKDLRVLRQLSLGDGPAAVCGMGWSEQGKLAVLLARGDALVFQLKEARETPGRAVSSELDVAAELVAVVKTGEQCSACCWKQSSEQLLIATVAGELRLMDVAKSVAKDGILLSAVTEVWRRPLAVLRPTLLAFSPDDRFLAVAGQHDRLVRVFEEPFAQVGSFFYLPHPRGVKAMQWRRIPRDKTGKSEEDDSRSFNVLLTSCRDEVHRFWMETQFAGGRMQFCLANVLDAVAGTVVAWLHSHCDREAKQKKERAGHVAPSRDNSVSRVRYAVKSEDWVVGLEPSGAVIIWGVQNLVRSRSQKFPTVFIWNKLAPIDTLDRSPRSIAAVGHSNLLEESQNLDVLNLFVVTQQGRMSSWKFFLRTNLSPVNRALMGAFWGHGATTRIVSVTSNAGAPLVCSVDSAGKAIVSEAIRTTVADAPVVFTELSELDNVASACWLCRNLGKNEAVLAVCTVDAVTKLQFVRFVRSSARGRFEWSRVGVVDVGHDCSALLISCNARRKNSELTLVGIGRDRGVAVFLSVDVDRFAQWRVLHVASSAGGRFVSASVAKSLYDEDLRHAVLLGSSDGRVSFWSTEGAMLGSVTVDADARSVVGLKCAYNGRFATHVAGSKEIVVWEMESSPLQVSLECKVASGSEAVFDWLPLQNGSHMLAMASGTSVKLMLEAGSRGLQSFAVSWSEAASFSGFSSPCSNVAFVGEGTLVVATAHELVVFTKWLAGEARESCSIFHKADALLRPLPLYHPKVLVEYMMGGQFAVVEHILRLVLDFLESGKQGIVPEPEPATLFLDEHVTFAAGTKSSTNSEALYASRDLSSSDGPRTGFGPEDALKLADMLAHVSLPAVTRKSQLHLLAVIDTFRHILEVGPGLDVCGTRFFISLKIFQFLRKTNTVAEFAVSNWAWALQSQAHDVLLSHAGANLVFDDLRMLGVPLWLKNPDKLKLLAENVAKNQFLAKKDPFDCMLMYVALKRISVLSKMFKVAKKDKVAEFLMHDFTQERWQTAALKNAYSSLKTQQFGQAAAFFLVGGKIRDCLGLLLKHEKDFMMAVVVARLWDGSVSGENVRWVLQEHVLPLAETGGDAWLASIARWLLGDFVGSFHALLQSEANAAPYSLSSSASSEFKPVVMYYTEHLLSATELIKHKKMDLSTLVRLRRKTAYATFNAGCVYHALDRLIGMPKEDVAAPAEAKAVAVVEVPAKKSAPSTDAGTMSFSMFDDGFGDMPTPAWMLPKEEANEAASNALATTTEMAGKGFGETNGESSWSAEVRHDVAQMDSVMKVKVATMFLIGMCPRLLQMCVGEGKWNEASLYIDNTAHFLTEKLSGDDSFFLQLLSLFKEYCEVYHCCVPHYLLLDSSDGRTAFFLHYAWEISLGVTGSLTTYYPLASTQAAEIAAIANELLRCYGHFSSGGEIEATLQVKFLVAVALGRFFSGWVDSNFAALFEVLFDEKPPETRREDGDEDGKVRESDSSEPKGGAEEFLAELVNFLVLDAFVAKVFVLLGVQGDTEKLMGKYAAASLEVRVADSLRRYEGDLLELLRAKFELVLPSLNENEDHLSSSKWIDVLRNCGHYRRGGAFASLCDKLATTQAVERVLEKTGVAKLIKSRRAMAAVGAKHKPSFGPPLTLVHENDILHNFCIGMGEKVSFVVATSRGQAELALDVTEATAKAFIQQQQKFKNVSDSGSLRMSPDRSGKSQQQSGPVIPPAAFMAQSDVASCVCPHPTLPFYLSAGVDGSIYLHQFGFPELLTPYRKAPATRVHSIKFATAGSRFGAVDEGGNLSLWQFESNDSQRPFVVIPCHSKRANDLCFLDSANVVATAGLSSKSHAQSFNVAVWDTLLSPAKACVVLFNGHAKGATTLVYSESNRLLISGGKTGEISLWDMRMQKLLTTVPAHSLNVRTMALDDSLNILASGSSDGSMRIWSLPDMSEVATFPDAHKQQTFTKNQSRFLTSPISTFGVMSMCFWNNRLLSSGADGRLTSRELTEQ